MSNASLRGPYILEAKRKPADLANFIRSDIEDFPSLILESGAVLFRGFDVRSAEDFQRFLDAIGGIPIDYTYKSTPRTRVSGNVFTATEYPSQLEIPLHCENSYQKTWPMWISLCCLKRAAQGGQTPIADMRRVTVAIAPEILERFANRGVKYIRHYRPYVDLSWQDVFHTNDRDEVARFCEVNGIEYHWLDRETLRTEQTCQGVADHPITGEKVFFNQAHLFHVSSLESRAAMDMISVFGRDRLPRDAKFGDDSEIARSDLETIRGTLASAAVDIEWQEGDVALLDNMQFAHGRRSYRGERRVLAALLNPYSPSRSIRQVAHL